MTAQANGLGKRKRTRSEGAQYTSAKRCQKNTILQMCITYTEFAAHLKNLYMSEPYFEKAICTRYYLHCTRLCSFFRTHIRKPCNP